MNVRLTDGTTTVDLNKTSPVQGATYFPSPPDATPDGWAEEVSETCEVLLIGTATAIRATVNSIERLFESARQRQRSGSGARLYVEYEAVTGDTYYRSEILYGRLAWAENPAARRLSDTTPRVQVAIHWTRRHFWEGALTAIALTSSADGSPVTTPVTLYSNDDATPAATNWIGIANTQITGTLPAPIKLKLAQADATGRAWRTFWLANNVYSDPTGMDPFLLGSEEDGGGASPETSTWATAIDHSQYDWIWEIPAAQLADLAGRYWRILTTFSATDGAGWYVRADIAAASGGVYQTLWEGDEVYVTSTGLYDLGALPIPPGGYDVGAGNIALIMTVRAAGAGNGTVDFVQFTPTQPGMLRKITQLGFTTAQNDLLVDDGPEGLCYYEDGSTGAHYLIMRGENEPLYIWPGITQRLRVLVAGSTWTAGWSLTAQAWFRPRTLTV